MKITLITGASSGIGKELAHKALNAGHTVIINARRKERLEELQKISPERVVIVEGDITSSEVRAQTVLAIEKFGRLDYLFNNAGFGWYGRLENESNVAEMVNLNVTALIEMSRLCIPYLKKSERGRILNISSVLGKIEIPFMSTYVATKFAVVGFTHALNMELAYTNISATVFCPSGVKTEFGTVAAGRVGARQTDQYAESTEKVVTSIWNSRDTYKVTVYPTFIAWLTVAMTGLLRPFIASVMKGIVRKKISKVP